ncbi:HAD family hydrolase [Pedobacter cryoconitis]|uniref:HAD family hydrolase n=1 Tax=Pedobacter cryoconitis TaxID=188932 RepID=UPI00161E39DA|nr:HAD family hydrolase [Pedobacter cryoconitis]MBB5646476.1 phosphoglycolate phosphatase/pyrophosphatase PpaX [Pedobacter cryoconitis]
MKINTIIFDLDGTIADTLPLCIAAFKKSIEPLLGSQISEQEIVATFGPSEEGTIRKLVPENEEAGIKSYLEHYIALHHSCAHPFEGIKELLQFLKDSGVHLAMVTGKGVHSTKISLEQFGLSDFFNVLETGRAEGPDKSNGIKRVINRLNVDQSQCIYVGDAPSDILASKKAGISIASAAWAETTDAQELLTLSPNWIFYCVQEFRDWITKFI